jgi:hypothetical protein
MGDGGWGMKRGVSVLRPQFSVPKLEDRWEQSPEPSNLGGSVVDFRKIKINVEFRKKY